jgi:hypothetical protein
VPLRVQLHDVMAWVAVVAASLKGRPTIKCELPYLLPKRNSI